MEAKHKAKKLGTVLYRLFLCGFILFPLVTGFLVSSKTFTIMQYKKFSLLLLSMFFLILALSFSFIKTIGKTVSDKDRKKIRTLLAAILFLISVGIKYFLIVVMGSSIYQNSEYGCVWRISSGIETTGDLQHISVFPHWSLVGFINRFILNMFNENSIMFCQLINAIILSISVVLLFYIGYEITKRLSSAFLGALLFAIAPTENLYFLMLSNEFIAIIAFLTITYIFLKNDFFIVDNKKIGKMIFWIILLSISYWLLKYSKPIGKVFAVALIISGFLEVLVVGRKKFKQLIFVTISSVILLFIVSSLYIHSLESYTGYPVNRDQAAHFLFIGLHSEYSRIGNVYEKNMAEQDFNYDRVNEQYMEAIKRDIRLNINQLPQKLKNNFEIQWKDYKNGLRMVTYEYGKSNADTFLFTAEGLNLWWGTITQLFYILILFFTIGSVFLKLLFEPKLNIKYFFLCLLCFGVSLGLLFGESQERYKCIIVPILYLLAGDGMARVYSYVENKIEKIHRRIN